MMKILTIFNDATGCLSQKATPIPLTEEGLAEAKQIAAQLLETLTPLMPAAGLAAPQIGISKQIFIFSWDRTLDNMAVALNPEILELSDDTYFSWEACFSTMQKENVSQAVYLSRSKSLIVAYRTLDGEIVKQKLDGFAAKVFQHEFDHLQGIVDTEKAHSEAKTFSTDADLITFMQNVKKEDSLSYQKPIAL